MFHLWPEALLFHYTTNVMMIMQQIYRAIKAADVDGSGTIGVGELYTVITNLVNTKRAVKSLGKLVVALLVVLVLALASIFVVSMLAGEAIKESHVKGSLMTAKDGSALQVDGATSGTTLFELPLEDAAGLAKINYVSFAVDMRSDPTIAAWVDLSMDVSVAYKPSYGRDPSAPRTQQNLCMHPMVDSHFLARPRVFNSHSFSHSHSHHRVSPLADVAYLKSSAGSVVTLNRITQTGTYSFNGATYPIQEDLPASVQASLTKANAPLPNYGATPPSNRRSLRRGRRAQKVQMQGSAPAFSSLGWQQIADGNN